MAAAAGVASPYPYQAWELRVLAEERQRLEWNRHALLCATVVNAQGPRRPVRPDDFNPFAERRVLHRTSAADLDAAFAKARKAKTQISQTEAERRAWRDRAWQTLERSKLAKPM